MNDLPFWPQQASAYAARIDWLFAAFGALIVALSLPVFILVTVYAIRYRSGVEAERGPRKSGNVWLETAWAIIPFILTLGFFAYAAILYLDLGRAPADALVIDVVAKQWMWKFEHPGGQREIDDLHLPAGRDVALTMTSQDVIHSFFVPALRIKQDVLPGRYTQLWFKADRPGVYDLRCSQFCGMNHSEMIGRVFVMPAGDYAAWLAQAGTDGDLAQQGAALYQNLGCAGCHSAGSTVRAPPLAGLYGHPAPLSGGRVVIADDQYIRDSILDPNRDVAAGYAPVMPSFSGRISEDELIRLTAYLKSIGSQAPEHRP